MYNECDFRVAELMYMERLAEAEQDRLLRQVPRPPVRASVLRVRCGQLLVHLGERLAGMTAHPHEHRRLHESESAV
jgi:hypothetical protein